VECLPGEGLGSSDWDYAPGTVGTPGTPEDAVREQIPWLRPDDALDRAGYPKADPPRVRILREGRAFGIVTLQSDGQGGWLVETVDRCYA